MSYDHLVIVAVTGWALFAWMTVRHVQMCLRREKERVDLREAARAKAVEDWWKGEMQILSELGPQ